MSTRKPLGLTLCALAMATALAVPTLATAQDLTATGTHEFEPMRAGSAGHGAAGSTGHSATGHTNHAPTTVSHSSGGISQPTHSFLSAWPFSSLLY